MTILDLTPRLAAARRRQQQERLGAGILPPGSAELLAAQLRLLLLPALIGSLLLEEVGQYFETMLRYGTARGPSGS